MGARCWHRPTSSLLTGSRRKALLEHLDPDVEVIDAGKAPHAHTLTQDEINTLIVERALAGQRVVRLKGGDPFVLGRGSEELAACRAAGVDVTVVPGITSALAVPAAAGIPVTARGITSRFTVVSGHDGPLDFAPIAALDGTLLFLMGVSRLPEIARELQANGRPADGAGGCHREGHHRRPAGDRCDARNHRGAGRSTGGPEPGRHRRR